MRFQRPERLRFDNNPLIEVVSQIRFPKLLRLIQELPAAFQERVQADYPSVEIAEVTNLTINLTPAVGAPTPALDPEKIFTFKSLDGVWKLSLTPESLALTTSKYVSWDDFKRRWNAAIRAFLDIYAPPRITRIGLRYIDIIDQGKLGIGLPWQTLVRAPLCGLLSSDVPLTDLQDARTQAILKLEPRGMLGLRFGLAQQIEPPRPVFLLDGDFFDDTGFEGRELDAVFGLLDDFNVQAGGLFQWAFTGELLRHLGPQRIA